jgi:uncharacterized YkwD family protein
MIWKKASSIASCLLASTILVSCTMDQGVLPLANPPTKTKSPTQILAEEQQVRILQTERMRDVRDALAQDELRMLELINEERADHGLLPLQRNEQLTELARLKALNMIHYDYFSHTSPTFGGPFDMMDRHGITYLMAAENIAGSHTLKEAHTTLLNSPGHRANMLNPAFREIGIGINRGGDYGHVFVQLFITPHLKKPK